MLLACIVSANGDEEKPEILGDVDKAIYEMKI